MNDNKLLIVAALLLAPVAVLHAATHTVVEPLDYQVIQRSSRAGGTVRVRGTLADLDAGRATVEARIVADGKAGPWRRVDAKLAKDSFEGALEVPAGGWYRLEVRVLMDDAVAVEAGGALHAGVGYGAGARST